MLQFRLIYEQTIMTWREGEQMIGFALAHVYIFLYLPMMLSFVLAQVGLACVASVSFARWLRRLPTPKWNWLPVVALLVCTGLVYVPYDVWMTTTIRLVGPGPHGISFLMLAVADGRLLLAKTLAAKGVSPNTMAGGSTALGIACSSRNLDVAKFLLGQGADISRAPNCTNLALTSQSGGTS
jgi:ankyrin repeat protein